MIKKVEGRNIHLAVDNIVMDLLCDYHNLTHSEIVSYYHGLIEQSIKAEGNIANDKKFPKFMFNKKGKAIWKTVTVDPTPVAPVVAVAPVNPNTQMPVFPWGVGGLMGTPKEPLHNHVWVVRGFYPESKVPFKLSIVLNRDFESKEYFCKVVLGDKTKATRFTEQQLNAYQEEVAEAILLDKDIKALEQIPYTRKTFKCMRPKTIPLLKKAK